MYANDYNDYLPHNSCGVGAGRTFENPGWVAGNMWLNSDAGQDASGLAHSQTLRAVRKSQVNASRLGMIRCPPSLSDGCEFTNADVYAFERELKLLRLMPFSGGG